jgi:hypothetical protein
MILTFTFLWNLILSLCIISIPAGYVTLADFEISNQLETYEISEGDTFESFNHNDDQKLEGRGFSSSRMI